MKYTVGQKLSNPEVQRLPVGAVIRNTYGEIWLKIDSSGVKWRLGSSGSLGKTHKASSKPFVIEYLPPQPIEVGDEITYEDMYKLPKGSMVKIEHPSGSIQFFAKSSSAAGSYILSEGTCFSPWYLDDITVSGATLTLIHRGKS